MKWIKKNDYYIESLGNPIDAIRSVGYSISKSTVYGNSIYEAWELPYDKPTLICRGDNVSDVKAQTVQYHRAKLASASSETKRSIGGSPREELASANQGALF